MSNTNEKLWQDCLDLIKAEIGDEMFNNWFSSTRFVDFSRNELTLLVPSQYISQQYDSRFEDIFFSSIEKVFGMETQVFYQYDIIQGEQDTRVQLPSTVTGINKGGRTEGEIHPSGTGGAEEEEEFDDRLSSSYTFDNYCVSSSNRYVWTIGKAIADHPEDNSFNPLFLYGNVGVGKTHLMQAIGRGYKQKCPHAKVLYVQLLEFINQLSVARVKGSIPDLVNYYKNIDMLLVDDIQEMAGKQGTINTLFSIFNYLHQSNKKLIFSCDRPPMELKDIADRMIDRFKWGSVEPIPNPDFELRKKILYSKAKSGGLNLSDEIIDVIAKNMQGSVRELEAVVAGLILRAVRLSVPLSTQLAMEVMRNTVKSNTKSINFDMIVEITAERFKINPDVIFSRSKVRDISEARQIIMFIADKHLNLPSTSIAAKLKRKHTTVLHGITTIKNRLSIEKDMADSIEWIEKELFKERNLV